MWVLGWHIDDDIHPQVAVDQGIAMSDWSETDKILALFSAINRRTSSMLVHFPLCDVDGEICVVVAISRDEKATSDEDAKPGDLPPFKEGMIIRDTLGYESGPWWYEVKG